MGSHADHKGNKAVYEQLGVSSLWGALSVVADRSGKQRHHVYKGPLKNAMVAVKAPSHKKGGEANIDPEWALEMMQKIVNPCQTEDNKTQVRSAKRHGASPKVAPCCLPFGKDFRCFSIISRAHSAAMLAFPPFFWEGLFHLPRCSQMFISSH